MNTDKKITSFLFYLCPSVSVCGPTPGLLFVLQCDYRIDADGTPGGDIGRDGSDQDEQCGDCGEDEWIGGANPVEHAAQEARHPERSRNADRHTYERDDKAASNHESQDVSAAGAERHAESDLTGAATDGVGGQSVD